jgi:hypothetical protein
LNFARVCPALLSTDLPDGQISDMPVQPLQQKYFPSRPTQIKSIFIAVPSHRGALRNVINAGRDAVDVDGARTNVPDADGEVV